MATTNCVICATEVDIESNYKMTYGDKEQPICKACSEKIALNVDTNAILNTQRGKLLNELVKSVFDCIYGIFNDKDPFMRGIEYTLFEQPRLSDIQFKDFMKSYNREEIYTETDVFKSLMNKIGNITDDDVKMIEAIWKRADDYYYDNNEFELQYLAIMHNCSASQHRLGYTEMKKFIELVKTNTRR